MKTKKWRFLLCFLMSVVSAFVLCPSVAFAQSADDVVAEIRAEVSEDGNDAGVTVYFKNIGNEPISNLQIQGNLPDGLELKEGNAMAKQEETVTPSSETALQYVLTLENKEAGTQKPGSTSDETDDGIDQNVNSGNTSENNQNQSANDNKITAVQYSPETGSDSPYHVSSLEMEDVALQVTLIVVCVVAASVTLLIYIKKRKTSKKLLSLILCFTVIATSLVGFSPALAADQRSEKLHVSTEVKLGGKDYVLTADVLYCLPESITPSGDTLTRAQWISELLEAVNAPDQEITYDNVTLPFEDIDAHANKNEILLAYANQILPEIGAEFRPDAPADREFAAVTAVKALGFQPVAEIECVDSASITYKEEVETAVAMDIFRLTNEKFYPYADLTRSEANWALQQVRAIVNVEVPQTNTGGLHYDAGVVVVPDSAVYDVNGSSITFTSGIDHLPVGTVLVLPDQTPYKVLTTQKNGYSLVVETAQPDINETLDSITANGTATLDASRFEPAEGVTMLDNLAPMTRSARINIVDAEGSLAAPGKLEFEVHKEIGIGTLYGKFSISLAKVLYKADVDLGWGGFNVKDVYLKFPVEMEIDGGYEVQRDGAQNVPQGGVLELGKIPVVGIPGVAIYVQIGLKYEVSGKIELVYNINGETGIQILNNRPRTINSMTTDLDLKALGGSAKIGPSLSGLLEVCNRWNLIDFGVSAGAKANGEMIVRNPSFFCLDASIFVYGEISALDEGVIGDWLDIGYTWEFWDSNNTPWKINGHWENFIRVDECTFDVGNGSLAGMVASASDRRTPIVGATIAAYSTGSNRVEKSVQSDANGNYLINLLPAGEYVISISAPGYMSFECNITIAEDEEKYTEAFLMIDEGQEGEIGQATGIITNALTGSRIEGATLALRKGWNQTTGTIVKTVQTDESGRYQLQVAIGNYTATIEKDGYITNTKNIVVMTDNAMAQNATLNPIGETVENADLRIVLTWGESPRDLDSHFVGPTTDGADYFHVYFSDKQYNDGSSKVADLDVDDTSSYGPETTSLYKKNALGTYSFYVHDYTNSGNTSSTAMSQSGAIVEVYLDGNFYKAYPVPTGQSGVYWHVFDYDAATNTIKDVNRYEETIAYPSQRNTRTIAAPVLFSNIK